MNRAKVLIVEDERLAANALHRLLLRDPEMQVVGISADGKTAIRDIQQLQPEIVFLDIQIPEDDGFAVIETIGVEYADCCFCDCLRSIHFARIRGAGA